MKTLLDSLIQVRLDSTLEMAEETAIEQGWDSVEDKFKELDLDSKELIGIYQEFGEEYPEEPVEIIGKGKTLTWMHVPGTDGYKTFDLEGDIYKDKNGNLFMSDEVLR